MASERKEYVAKRGRGRNVLAGRQALTRLDAGGTRCVALGLRMEPLVQALPLRRAPDQVERRASADVVQPRSLARGVPVVALLDAAHPRVTRLAVTCPLPARGALGFDDVEVRERVRGLGVLEHAAATPDRR
jgi:hypothetical protein